MPKSIYFIEFFANKEKTYIWTSKHFLFFSFVFFYNHDSGIKNKNDKFNDKNIQHNYPDNEKKRIRTKFKYLKTPTKMLVQTRRKKNVNQTSINNVCNIQEKKYSFTRILTEWEKKTWQYSIDDG